MSRTRPLLMVVLVALAVFPAARPARGVTATGSSPTSTHSMAWTPWPNGPLAFKCATVTVPLDGADPGGTTIDLAMSRLPAADPTRRIGSLLINFGGPGVAGVGELPNFAVLLAADAGDRDNLVNRFDLVAFDPRGIGRSAPLDCGIDLAACYATDPTPDDSTELAAWVAGARQVADACGANAGPLLTHMGTKDVVEDVERVRQALGEDRISFLGISYGTSIGARYADRPRSLRLLAGSATPLEPPAPCRRTTAASGCWWHHRYPDPVSVGGRDDRRP